MGLVCCFQHSQKKFGTEDLYGSVKCPKTISPPQINALHMPHIYVKSTKNL